MGGPDKIPQALGAGRIQAALKGRVLQGFFLFIPVIKGPYSPSFCLPRSLQQSRKPMSQHGFPLYSVHRYTASAFKKDTADLGQQGHQAAFQFFLL